MKKQVEVLAPAGSYECLKAAVCAGADAVYVGGSRFGARAYADNFSEEELLDAIDYAHLHGVSVYLTVNTLLKEEEMRDLYEYLLPYYERGLDAVIVQDIGVIAFVRKQFPNLPVHASTQMTVTGASGAKVLEELGVSRVVTSRELQLQEIRSIAENTKLEIESFVHGALCYSYSGQCLYSSLIGGRSGNRGQCAQPCRLLYQAQNEQRPTYLMSLKDMCTLEILPNILEAGVYSLKIEGRMKKPEYVALVTSMYRKYVDLYLQNGRKGYAVDPEDMRKLMDIYNRGGFWSGYYETVNGREMLCRERPNHAGVPALKVVKVAGKQVTAKALLDINKGDVIELPEEKENYTFGANASKGQTVTFVTHKKQPIRPNQILSRLRNEKLLTEIRENFVEQKVGQQMKKNIQGKMKVHCFEPLELEVTCDDCRVKVCGPEVVQAQNRPMDQAQIIKQMRKTGNTEFVFTDLDIDLEGEVFVPVQALNELRREAIEKLREEIVSAFRRERPVQVNPLTDQSEVLTFCDNQKVALSAELPNMGERENLRTGQTNPQIFVSVETKEQFESVLKAPFVERIYVDCNAVPAVWKNSELTEWTQKAHEAKKQVYLIMPYIFREKTEALYEEGYGHIFEADPDGVMIRNYESYGFLRRHGYKKGIVADYNLYQFNRWGKEFWESCGIEATTAPVEQNSRELKEVGVEGSELIVYGHLPMMISAQCIQKTTKGCTGHPGQLVFTDRFKKDFTVKNNCDYCYNVIYNTSPLVLYDEQEEIQRLAPKAVRLQFTIEDKNRVNEILRECSMAQKPEFDFTRGHFRRGVK